LYDTVEVPLTAEAPFSSRIAPIKLEVEAHVRERLKSDIPFRTNIYYEEVVDLRKVADIDAVLHLNAKKTGSHKIQIVEAGKKCRGQIADTISQIVDGHPELLSVSRVDSCADIVDGPTVRWMAQNVRARYTQWQAQFGTIEVRPKIPSSDMGKREVQTVYMGKRPNCFRVYDKLAERHNAWTYEKRRHERLASEIVCEKVVEGSAFARPQEVFDGIAKRLVRSGRHIMPFPDFPTWFAAQCVGPMTHLAPELPKVLTRVERQMAAGRVPEPLDTFDKLFSQRALDFNPFDRLEFSSFNPQMQIDKSAFSPVDYAAGMQFKQWLESGAISYQFLFASWDKNRNGKRTAAKFAPFIAAANPPNEISITSSELYERYRNSVSRQLAA
jgi:hypothetical protein